MGGLARGRHAPTVMPASCPYNGSNRKVLFYLKRFSGMGKNGREKIQEFIRIVRYQ